MTSQDIAAILTGLRSLQADLLADRESRGINGNSLMDILTNGYEFEPIDAVQIDRLCERINTQPPNEW